VLEADKASQPISMNETPTKSVHHITSQRTSRTLLKKESGANVNNESKNTIQVIDVKTWKATASWPLDPCKGPTGIAYDKASDCIFSGCNNTSVVVDPNMGNVVSSIKNGTRVDALGWERGESPRRGPLMW